MNIQILLNDKILILCALLWILFINYLTFTYLNDIQKNKKCKTINSFLLEMYYNYAFLILITVSILIVFIIYLINMRLNIIHFIRLSTIKDFIKQNMTYIRFITVVISLFYLKLLYDISYEEECKDIDKNKRITLFIYHMIGLLSFVYLIIKKKI